MRVAILDDYLRCALDLADWSRVTSRAEVTVFTEPFGGPEPTVEALRGFDALCLMRDRTPLSAGTLSRLPDLRYLTFTGKANATLDIPAAKAQGITVSVTPGNLNASTIELTWALILATVRAIPRNDASLRAGRWQAGLGTMLSGATLGVIGLGRMGVPVAALGRAFGMDVIAWSRHLTPDAAAAAGARSVDRDTLFAEADVVTVHVPLSDGSRGLIGARELGLMKPTAYLVNTSRGPIVDQEALIEALHAGTIAGAGLDVYDVEPLPAGHPLIAAPNTVLLPHLGFVSRKSMAVFYQDSADNLAAWLDGTPANVI